MSPARTRGFDENSIIDEIENKLFCIEAIEKAEVELRWSRGI
jgi:hypothetical protein